VLTYTEHKAASERGEVVFVAGRVEKGRVVITLRYSLMRPCSFLAFLLLRALLFCCAGGLDSWSLWLQPLLLRFIVQRDLVVLRSRGRRTATCLVKARRTETASCSSTSTNASCKGVGRSIVISRICSWQRGGIAHDACSAIGWQHMCAEAHVLLLHVLVLLLHVLLLLLLHTNVGGRNTTAVAIACHGVPVVACIHVQVNAYSLKKKL